MLFKVVSSDPIESATLLTDLPLRKPRSSVSCAELTFRSLLQVVNSMHKRNIGSLFIGFVSFYFSVLSLG